MSTPPLISVIIPTRHRNDLLAKCLDCLHPDVQTLSADQYEVIVTDDGSDSTAEQMIHSQYPWVKWASGPRKGPAANRNNGAKLARGQWLVFTDDDCLPQEDWLLNFMSAIVDDVLIYEGKTICDQEFRSPLEHSPINLNGGCLWSCNMMVASSIFTTLGGFDETYPFPNMEDIDFRERLNDEKLNYLFVPKAIVNHPPRRLPWGHKLGASQESLVYFLAKKKLTRKQIKENFWQPILRTRIDFIIKRPKSIDTLTALFSLVTEILYILPRLDSWISQYLQATANDTDFR